MNVLDDNHRLAKNLFLHSDDRAEADEIMNQIFDACKERDVQAMKDLFAKTVLNEVDNMENSILALFDFFQGEVESYDDWSGPGVEVGSDFERTYNELQTTYDVTTSVRSYRFSAKIYTADTADPDNNVGIHSLYIIKTEDDHTDHAFWGDGRWTPGINILDNTYVSIAPSVQGPLGIKE